MEERGELDPGLEVAGAYRVLRRLGRGGMGEVYEVEHLRTHRRLALKTLRRGLGAVREIAARFEREAQALSRLSHPGIVQVEDFGHIDDGDGALFLVMELLRGQSLRAVIDEAAPEGGLAPARAAGIAARMLEALAYAHAQGVIHRDLKPDNVNVAAGLGGDGGDLVKILDFGIAKLVGEAAPQKGETLTQAGIAFGTPDYMAPEQALGSAMDARADLYQVGVILYEMLTGRLPFESEEPLAVARMHVALDAPTLASKAPGRELGAALEAVVARALAKRPAERFAGADEMAAALLAAVAGGAGAAIAEPPTPRPETVTPAPTPLPARPSRAALAEESRGRRRVLVTGGVVAAVAVVVALVAAGGGGGGGEHDPTALAAATLAPASVVPPSPLADEATRLLEVGDAEAAVRLLEAQLTTREHAGDARAHLVLGHGRMALARPLEALAAYERAAVLAPPLAGDTRAVANVAGLVDGKDQSLALAALDYLGRAGDAGEAAVVAAASRAKSFKTRRRAQALAEQRGVARKIDRLEMHIADLGNAPSCEERREALRALRKLGDARAVPAIKKARARRSGFFNQDRPNWCLEKEAAAVIAELEPARPK